MMFLLKQSVQKLPSNAKENAHAWLHSRAHNHPLRSRIDRILFPDPPPPPPIRIEGFETLLNLATRLVQLLEAGVQGQPPLKMCAISSFT